MHRFNEVVRQPGQEQVERVTIGRESNGQSPNFPVAERNRARAWRLSRPVPGLPAWRRQREVALLDAQLLRLAGIAIRL